jgi:hypothetical protein
MLSSIWEMNLAYAPSRMCRPAKIGALLTLLTLVSWTASGLARGARIELIKRLWGIGEVRVQLVDGSRTLERFATPHRVEATEISADEALAFVWHQGDRPPLRLSIYDLRARTRLAEFAPGFGGDLHFTPRGKIIHTWGCGSNCHSFAIYDRHGKTLQDGGASGLEVSPERGSMLAFPSFIGAQDLITLYDLETGKPAITWSAPENASFVVDSIAWRRSGTIEVDLTMLRGEGRLTLRRLASGRMRASFARK